MISPATSTPLASSIPSRPGEEFTSSTSGPRCDADQVDTGDAESEHARGADRDILFGRAGAHALGAAAAMQVGAEVALGRLPLHRRDHAATDHEAAHVGTARLLDEFLDQEVGVEAAQAPR